MRHTVHRVAVLAALASLLLSVTANAAPIHYNADLSAHMPSSIEKVWCRHGYCDGDGGASVGGLIGGLVGGAIAAGAAASAAQQDAQAAAQQHAAVCAQRYRSYDPASNTYLSKGKRFPCQ